LAMFGFVGALMGIALCTKAPLALDLPSTVWKQLLGHKVEASDLEAVDKLCVHALAEISALSAARFEYVVMPPFHTQLSDNTEVELKKDGKLQPVTFELRNEYVDLSIKRRLEESSKQVDAIQKGLNAVVPVRLLSLFSWFDLENMVCGNPFIDIEMLKRHTTYTGGITSSSPLVKYFFDALRSFNQEERQMFLRFVWGRNRLPPTDSDWSTKFTINPLPKAGDESLPIAHTCFFSIDLPNYTSLDILKKKILYAIFNCTAIDVDFNPSSSGLQAWVD